MADPDRLVERRKAFRRGIFAEYWAAAYLLAKGYRIVSMRYRVKSGEIDIIARKKDLIAFVEVKARRTELEALAAVGIRSQQRIHSASLKWISKQKDASRLSWRYDVIAICPRRLPAHFPDAFRPGSR